MPLNQSILLFIASLRRLPRFLLLACLTLALTPPAPASPHAIVLDGLRDPDYVLIAEDPAGDLAPAVYNQVKFRWSDLTRLYVDTDSSNLYVYVDLPSYSLTHSVGQIGLSILIPGGGATGPRSDLLRPTAITYAYEASAHGGCPPTALPQTRHPDVLIRGNIWGAFDGSEDSNGFTVIAYGGGSDWTTSGTDWGGILDAQVDDRLAYSEAYGVELSIPWTDLGLPVPNDPTDLDLSFFTTTGNNSNPIGNFDAIPNDPAASAAPTSTVLSQLANLALPLPSPASVAFGCAIATVPEAAGVATLTAQLHTALTQTVAVSYTASALTAGPSDFTPHTGTVTFSPLTTQQTVTIPIADDTLVEPSETFLVTLSNPQGLLLAAPLTATITILDNDVVNLIKLFVPLFNRQ
jgi:hypothetical protein